MVYPLLYMGHRAIPVPYPAARRSTHSSRTTFGMQMWSTRFGFIWHAFLVATLGANEFTGSKSYNNKASLNLHRPSGLSKDHPKISEDRKYHKGSLGKVRKKRMPNILKRCFFLAGQNLLVHVADNSYSLKPWDICTHWARSLVANPWIFFGLRKTQQIKNRPGGDIPRSFFGVENCIYIFVIRAEGYSS